MDTEQTPEMTSRRRTPDPVEPGPLAENRGENSPVLRDHGRSPSRIVDPAPEQVAHQPSYGQE
jgi:hypothetical protein